MAAPDPLPNGELLRHTVAAFPQHLPSPPGAAYLSNFRRSSAPSKTKNRPILVTGAIRSGTTWVGRTISQHPSIRYVHEPFNPDYPNENVGLELDTWFSHYQSSDRKDEIRDSFNELLQPSPLKYAVDYAVRRCGASSLGIKTPLRFGKHVVLGLFSEPTRILVKDPLALLSAGWLYKTYNFKVVVIIRSPLAFAGSMKKAGWDFDFGNLRKQKSLMQDLPDQFVSSIESMCAAGNGYDLIDRVALLWNVLHFVVLKYQKDYPEWLFIKYEDIAANPGSEFSKIFDYLGLRMSEDILKYIEDYTSQGNPKDATSASYQPRDSKLSLHTWSERLSSDDIERVKSATRNIAFQFYEDIVQRW